MKVRAKFVIDSVLHTIGSVQDPDTGDWNPAPVRSVKMHPVYGGDDPTHENSKFWQATPSGQIELNVVNAAAVEGMKPGQEFYVDFTPAPAD